MDGAEFLIAINTSLGGVKAGDSALAGLTTSINQNKTALSGLESQAQRTGKALALRGADGKFLKKGSEDYKKAQDNIANGRNPLEGLAKSANAVNSIPNPFKRFGGAAQEGGVGINEFQQALRSVGPAARFVDGPLGRIVRLLGRGGIAGAAIGAAAIIVVLTAALVGLGVALSKYALDSADAARSQHLLNEAAAGSARETKYLDNAISAVAGKTPLATSKIEEMARKLELAGVKGKSLSSTLEAMAYTASAVGHEAAEKLNSIADASIKAKHFALKKDDLASTGIAFKDVATQLAKSMHTTIAAAEAAIKNGKVSVEQGMEAMDRAAKAKFGKTVAGQMLSLTVQFDKLKENLAKLFEGIKIEPFLKGLKSITDLFSQNTFTGQTLHKVLVGAMNGIFAAAAKAFPYIKAFLQGVIIGGLILYLGFLKIKKAIEQAFGGGKSQIDWIKTSMYAGAIAVIALVGVLVLLTVVIGALIASVFILTAIVALPFLLPVVAAYLLYKAIDMLVQKFLSLGSIDLAGIGSNIVAGLVSGIEAMAGNAVAAVTALASKIKTTIQDALQIHSPSAVFAKYGNFTAQGFAQGVDKGADQATDAIEGLGKGKPGGGGKGGKLHAGGPVSIVLNIYAAMGESEIEKTKEAIADLFEEDLEGSEG